MVKVKIKQKDYEVEAEEVIEKKVMPFGKGSGHVTIPKKWIGYKVMVVVLPYLSKKGMFGGYVEKYPEKFGNLKKKLK